MVNADTLFGVPNENKYSRTIYIQAIFNAVQESK
jgi:hypothetical protein